jgi:L-fucose mutarotase
LTAKNNQKEGGGMLRGISPLISPELLKVLSEMGHGDEIVLADANFPTENYGQRAIRADGISAAALLEAILPHFPLDQYDEDHFVLMEVAKGDDYKPVVWEDFKAVLHRFEPQSQAHYMERFAYYERAKKAFAIVATGEKAKYANIILKKGVVS